jgi:TfoX/Sxy family transcriptional regulator of competence genes
MLLDELQYNQIRPAAATRIENRKPTERRPGLCHNGRKERPLEEHAMPMKWKKAPPELISLFDRVVPKAEDVDRRSMFGYPCAFNRGNMFSGLFADSLFVRLPGPERTKMIEEDGGGPLAPMPGRIMKDYTVVPAALLGDEKALGKTIRRSLDFTRTLPAKSAAEAKAKSPSSSQRKR